MSNDGLERMGMLVTKKHCLETMEHMTLKGLGEEVSKHLISGTVSDADVPRTNAIFEPEIVDVDVM